MRTSAAYIFPGLRNSTLKPSNIIRLVSKYYDITPQEMKSNTRLARINWPRQVAIYFIKTHTKMKLQEVGDIFGRHHSTVIHAITRVRGAMFEQSVMKELSEIEHGIKFGTFTRITNPVQSTSLSVSDLLGRSPALIEKLINEC